MTEITERPWFGSNFTVNLVSLFIADGKVKTYLGIRQPQEFQRLLMALQQEQRNAGVV
jgi:hypothetical protein